MSQAPLNNPGAFPPRKRVVAREVAAEEIEAANREAVGVTPEDLLIVPPPRGGEVVEGHPPEVTAAAEPVTVVDPTTLGGRRRRSSHHRLYRGTQICTMLSALLSAVAVICTPVGETRARACPARPGSLKHRGCEKNAAGCPGGRSSTRPWSSGARSAATSASSTAASSTCAARSTAT